MKNELPLFRPEVLAEQRTDWLGKVVLVTPPSARLFGLVALIIILTFGVFLTFGSFTNKVRVNGWLVAERGQARIAAPISGSVTTIHVREGTVVKAGDPLVVVSAEQRSSVVGATQAEISRLLTKRRNSLKTEIEQAKNLGRQKQVGLRLRIEAMIDEIDQLVREEQVQAKRSQLADRASVRLRKLSKKGYTSVAQVQLQQELSLEQKGRLRSLARERAERRRELVTLQAELNELPIRSNVEIATLNRAISEIDQAIAQTEVRRELVITAPKSGVVTGLQVGLGSNTSVGMSLMNIYPDGEDLVVHLYGSSRSIGFLEGGQTVKLSYDAYPYQKFGHQIGTIDAVSRSAISPGELPPDLVGLSELISSTEPIYKIVVAPEKQHVIAYGKSYSLQPGMRLAADILIESRRLYEWVLDPLYTLTGRL